MSEHSVESERKKYAKVYEFPGYGRVGHATKIAHHLIERVKPGAVLADFGCGRGASFPPFLAAGLRIVPVDHVDALLPEFRNRPGVGALIQASLWDDELPAVDYGVCTDVMEHIPPAFVDKTIENIASAVRYGCLWSVCHVQDVWGDRIGERLHLTIQPREWWTAQLEQHWYDVKVMYAPKGTTVYWTEHLNK